MSQLARLQEDLTGIFLLEPTGNFSEFESLLSQHLVYLLINDMERLLNILYRIDVDEVKFKSLFNLNNPKLIAPELAKLIIERQLQKIATREAYRNSNASKYPKNQ